MATENKIYRDKGAIGALLDEYERSLEELLNLLDSITPEELVTIVDQETTDKDCQSIQTILSHVIASGYAYSIYTRRQLGEDLEIPAKLKLDSISAYKSSLLKMFQYNEDMFEQYPDIKIEEFDPDKKMLSSWGQRFDVEQIYEHAIVHILRHRRQIKRFLQKLRA